MLNRDTYRGKGLLLNREPSEYFTVPFALLDSASAHRYFTFWYMPWDSTEECILSHSSSYGAVGTGQIQTYKLFKNTSNQLVLRSRIGTAGALVETLIGTMTLKEFNFIYVGSSDNHNITISLNGAATVTYDNVGVAAYHSSQLFTVFGGSVPDTATQSTPSNGPQTSRTPSTSFCKGVFDDFISWGTNISLANLERLYNSGKGRKPTRASFYNTFCQYHCTFDNNNTIKARGTGEVILFADSYHTEYEDSNKLYLDGFNDACLGVNGLNGFAISGFQGKTALTFNAIVDFKANYDKGSVAVILFELANAARTDTVNVGLGSYTGQLTNELITVARIAGGTLRCGGYVSTSDQITGIYMVTLTLSASGTTIYLNAVSKTITNGSGGAINNATSGLTIDRLTIGSSIVPSAYVNAIFKEISFFGKVLSGAEVTSLYDHYTNSGALTLSETTVSLDTHSLYSDGAFIELYKGNWDTGKLRADVSSTRDLQVNNLVLIPGESRNYKGRNNKLPIPLLSNITNIQQITSSQYWLSGVQIKVSDTKIIHFNRRATAHYTWAQGEIYKIEYDIPSETWGTPALVRTETAINFVDVKGGMIGSDVFVFTSRNEDNGSGGSTFLNCGYIKSTDGGASFGSYVPMPDQPTHPLYNFFGKTLTTEVAGEAYQFFYEFAADGSNYKIRMYKSTDSGVTWARTTVYDGALKTTECATEYLGGGKFIMLIRQEGGGFLYQTTSSDYGVTWSLPTVTNLGVSGSGSTFVSIPELCFDNGYLIVMHQQRNDEYIKYSINNPNTVFNNPAKYVTPKNYRLNSTGSQAIGYVTICPVERGLYSLLWVEEVSNSRADLYGTLENFALDII